MKPVHIDSSDTMRGLLGKLGAHRRPRMTLEIVDDEVQTLAAGAPVPPTSTEPTPEDHRA